jgi:hypothetical protein
MDFCKTNRTIIETYIGNSFQLPPTPFSIALFKQLKNTSVAANRNCSNVRNPSYDFKVHRVWKLHCQAEKGLRNYSSGFYISADLIILSVTFQVTESLAYVRTIVVIAFMNFES